MDPVFLVVGMVVLSAVYTLFMWWRGKAKMAAVNYEEERAKVGASLEMLLSGDYAEVRRWMQGQPVDAFTAAGVPTTNKDHAANMAKDALRSTAWAAVGVKATTTRVETLCYFVLSGGQLHFLDSDVDGNLTTHVVFDEASLGAGSISGPIAKSAGLMASDQSRPVYTLSLPKDGQTIELWAEDGLAVFQKVGAAEAITGGHVRRSAQAKVVSEHFFMMLGQRYPNLKVELAPREQFGNA